MSLSQPMCLDDDIGAVYLARMGPDTVKAPAREAVAVQQQQPQPQPLQQPHDKAILPASPDMQHGRTCLGNPPPLPERNALRRSRLLDALVLQTAVPSAAAAAVSVARAQKTGGTPLPTPHDVYLSSEEDASSAGDVSEDEDVDEYDGAMEDDSTSYGFSDQDGVDIGRRDRLSSPDSIPRDSPVPEPSAVSPTAQGPVSPITPVQPRRHHSRDTARIVSVIYSGKPSLIDLASERARRRSCMEPTTQPVRSSSASSTSASSSSCLTTASTSEVTRPSTSCDSLASHHSSRSTNAIASFRDCRCAMETVRSDDADLTSAIAAKKRTSQAFLLTDPFANSNMYHIDHATTARPLHPRRSFTSPHSGIAEPAPASQQTASVTSTSASILRGVTRSLTLSRRRSRPMLRVESLTQQGLVSPAVCVTPPLPTSMSVSSLAPSPVTYNDIVRSARRKSTAFSTVSAVSPYVQPVPEGRPISPLPPTIMPGMLKRGSTGGFLGNLAVRRRSMKTTR